MRTEEIRSDLVARLRARRPEVEQAVLVRVLALSDPRESAEPEYAQGLKAAVAAAVDYGIEALGRSDERPAPIPTALLSQARLAARNRVSLDTVLRRYVAGYTLLGDFVIEEAEHGAARTGKPLKRLLRAQATLLDRLIAAVSEEYRRELDAQQPGSIEQRRAERVQRLLAGELLDTGDLAYDLEGWHLGIVASGRMAAQVIKLMIEPLDCRLLWIPREEGVVWAWLGSRDVLETDVVAKLASLEDAAEISSAVGEPGEGIEGWRLTHRQASAALPIAKRLEARGVNYADVALLASVLNDDLLATSLKRLYLDPLSVERDGGEALRRTLHVYFEAQRNVSSAAAALGVSRRTVANRLQAVEAHLGRNIAPVLTEIDTALRLDELDQRSQSAKEETTERSTLARVSSDFRSAVST